MTPLMCLAVAVYFEARGEPIDGQKAIAEVVINRVNDDRYPNTICDVVFQDKQFSFTHDGKPDKLPKIPTKASKRAKLVAKEVLNGDALGITSTHYHAKYVTPYWRKYFSFDGVIGNHIFYTCDSNKPHC